MCSAHLEVLNSQTFYTGLPGIDGTAHWSMNIRLCEWPVSEFFGTGAGFNVCSSELLHVVLQFSHILGWTLVCAGNLLLSISKKHSPGVLCLMQIFFFFFNLGLCFAACSLSCLIIVDQVFYLLLWFLPVCFLWTEFPLLFSEICWLYGWIFWPCFECAPGTSFPSPPVPWAAAYMHDFLTWVKTILLLFVTALLSLSLHNFTAVTV